MTDISQSILNSLTRVKMPKEVPVKEKISKLIVGKYAVPLFDCHTLVIGSGAAGLRSAVEINRKNIDVCVASTGLYSGTSACSGSDKQTIHTIGTSNKGDDFVQMAKDISQGGAMDVDMAYIEAVGSVEAFAGLQYMGLPLPKDRFGAVLRYQTDHDEVGRATSCGPRTSRLMVKVLVEESIRLGLPFLKSTTVVKLIFNDNKNLIGVIAIKKGEEENPWNIIFISCKKVVLATGGPGELYQDSVYPHHCFGSLGMAIEAGLEVTNLTESQFGIGTRRQDFPWNLSGTYVQVLPYIYSVDKKGKEYNFLADFYPNTKSLVSNIFRKGYQWPFHATRMINFRSSLLDLAIFMESKKDRVIYMDFNRNPLPVSSDDEFSLSHVDDDVYAYLKNNDALQELPIDRLKKMNPLAIELYKMHGIDITQKPLAFNVNNQHMNGGINTDIWGKTSHADIYAIGEVAGTHGVTRPGGAALNAGQVFAIRVADHISVISKSANKKKNTKKSMSNETKSKIINDLKKLIEELKNAGKNFNGITLKEIKEEVQKRMSEYAGFICHVNKVPIALQESQELNKKIKNNILIEKPNQSDRYFLWKQMALTSQAVLTSLDYFISRGGGSRGARALCSPQGTITPQAAKVDLNEYRFIEEKDKDKFQKIVLKIGENENEISFILKEKKLRKMEDPSIIFFEKNWFNYLKDEIVKEGFSHQ